MEYKAGFLWPHTGLTRMVSIACLLVCSFASIASAQVTVTALAKKEPKDEVRCIRYGTVDETEVFLGMTLEVGDELICFSDNVALELSYGENSKLNFSGTFRVVILTLSEKNFAINLLSGGTDAITDERIGVRMGDVLLGVVRTQFGVRIYRDRDELIQECLVYEGEARITTPKLGRRISTAQKFVKKGKEVLPNMPIQKDDINRAADLYARVSVSKAQLAGMGGEKPLEVYSSFLANYAEVLGNPGSVENRLKLASQQINYNLSSEAIYYLNKADKLAIHEEQKAAVAMMKSFAFMQEGKPDEAKAQQERAMKIDPNVLNRVYFKNLKVREDLTFKRYELFHPALGTQDQLFGLLEKKQYKEAKEGFEKRLKSGQGNSRDYFGLALANLQLKLKSQARDNATKAIELNKKDKKLSREEIKMCHRIISSIGDL